MIRSISYTLLIAISFTLTLAGCDDNVTGALPPPDYSTVPAMSDTSGLEPVELEDGLYYYVIKEGQGSFYVEPAYDEVRMYYTLWREDNSIIASSYTNGRTTPQTITVYEFGTEGFQRGVAGMKRGERRVIVVPPSLGYSHVPENNPNYDLRNDTIVYEIEIAEIL